MNRHLWILAFFMTACAAASPQPGSTYEAVRNISFVSPAAGPEQALDIYLPKNAATNAPVHVFVHGGAWTKGDKDSLDPEQIRAFTDKGIILVSLNYRLGPEHKFPANVQDITTASLWLRNNIKSYGGDPDHMVLSGFSAGAHLVALFAVGTPAAPAPPSSSLYRAIYSVDTASYNLTQQSTGPLSRFVNKQKQAVFGDKPAVLKSASPSLQIEANRAYSRLYLYATQERPEAIAHMQTFQNLLEQAGQDVTAKIIGGGLSHKDMKLAMFTPGHEMYRDIIAGLTAR